MFEDLFPSPSILLDRHLETYLDAIWQRHFADVPRVNTVSIAYGRSWKCRLGSIRVRRDETLSHIAINALLSRPEVPIFVLVTTIAHELSHYAHGFGSPLPRLYPYPHANGVVTQELEKRGLGEALRQCTAWLDREWFRFATPLLQAGWPEQVLTIDMAEPPTPSHCFEITLSLQSGAWCQPTPTPLTEAEALWLQGYLASCFLHQQVHIQRVLAGPSAEEDERRFALEVSFRACEPIRVASFADWKRLQSWAAAPFRFEQTTHGLSEEQRSHEWKRIQQLRSLFFTVAQMPSRACVSPTEDKERP